MPDAPNLPIKTFDGLLREVGLATKTMLKQHRREPAEGQKPVACYWSGHEYVVLYRSADAVDMAPMSPGRQKRYDDNRTCAECGKKALDPWDKGRDDKRYCGTCMPPVHERLWAEKCAVDRPVIAEWASGILADPTVTLGASDHKDYWRNVYIVDLAGAVLVDGRVRHNDREPDETHPKRAEILAAMSPADLAAKLEGLRVIAWWRTTAPIAEPWQTTDNPDRMGPWWSRWVGKLDGTSYRYSDRVVSQRPPDGTLAEQVATMRTHLEEMAGGEG